ncbi:MAG: hypothetical protein AMXMBFR7_32100 [Planctomycetota bacterium]
MLLGSASVPLRVGLWLDDLKLDLRAALKRAAPWGLEAVGLDGFGAEVNPRTLTATGRRDLGHKLRGLGVKLDALKADVGGRRLGERGALDTTLACIREAFDLARDLGFARIWIPLGFVPPATDEKEASTRRALGEALAALSAFAAQTGLRPVLPAGSESSADLAAFLAEHDRSSLFEVDLQPGRLISRGEDPLNALQALSARVTLAGVTDAFRGGGEAPFGQGDVSWGHVIVGLSTLSRGDGVALLAGTHRDTNRLEALQATVEKLKKLRVSPLG